MLLLLAARREITTLHCTKVFSLLFSLPLPPTPPFSLAWMESNGKYVINTHGDNISIVKSPGDILFNLWFQFWTFSLSNSSNFASGGRELFWKVFQKPFYPAELLFMFKKKAISSFHPILFQQWQLCSLLLCRNVQFPSDWCNGKYHRWAPTHLQWERAFTFVPNTENAHIKLMTFWKQIILLRLVKMYIRDGFESSVDEVREKAPNYRNELSIW